MPTVAKVVILLRSRYAMCIRFQCGEYIFTIMCLIFGKTFSSWSSLSTLASNCYRIPSLLKNRYFHIGIST
jgi:hypothetical protein